MAGVSSSPNMWGYMKAARSGGAIVAATACNRPRPSRSAAPVRPAGDVSRPAAATCPVASALAAHSTW